MAARSSSMIIIVVVVITIITFSVWSLKEVIGITWILYLCFLLKFRFVGGDFVRFVSLCVQLG